LHPAAAHRRARGGAARGAKELKVPRLGGAWSVTRCASTKRVRATAADQVHDRRHPAGGNRVTTAGCRAYDTLIIDEAHERSLNIDFLLGYLKQPAAASGATSS
jgi:hypothetical protein